MPSEIFIVLEASTLEKCIHMYVCIIYKMYTFFECHFCGVFEEAVTAPFHFLLSQLLL